MICPKCEHNLIELSSTIDTNTKMYSGEFICEYCKSRFVINNAHIQFPSNYTLLPIDININPDYSLLKNICPHCNTNISGYYIVDENSIKIRRLDLETGLFELLDKKGIYQGFIYYHCDSCNTDFKLPFKLKNATLIEK